MSINSNDGIACLLLLTVTLVIQRKSAISARPIRTLHFKFRPIRSLPKICKFLLIQNCTHTTTVDHDILITRLQKRIGVTGSTIALIHSYLSYRKQSLKIPGGASGDTKIAFGVPQGSSLGPLLFTIYTVTIGNIISLHHLNYHLYADDTQLHIKFDINDENDRLSSLRIIEQCINDVRESMNTSLLKVNDDKTVALVLA